MTSSILEKSRIGFIGCGAMARALAGGLIDSGVSASQLIGSDPFPAARQQFEETLGAKAIEANIEVVSTAEIVILAVKPGAVADVLTELDPAMAKRPLWISIAAGVSLQKLQEALPEGTRIVRTMPNTPALVGAGATAYFPGARVDESDIPVIEAVLEATGWCWRSPNEDMLDAVTGLSGSGPAYIFLILEALAEAGVRQGLPSETALDLATRTVLGAAKMALETGIPPGVLRDQVTSPGGTTVAGLEQLEAHDVRAAFYAAVEAATARSKELREG
ncbi:MAG: pyrroline-5-carboxylate reductase [Myxococcota bacterium]